jgi:hypothetical protein
MPGTTSTLVTASSVSPDAPPRVPLLVAGMLVSAGAALALALRAPIVVTVLGLVAFGVLHNVLEIRYVAGRFAGVLAGRFLVLLLVLTTGIVGCRVVAPVWSGAKAAEIALGYLVLAAGVWFGVTRWARVVGWVVLAGAAWVSLGHPAYHFVVLTHLHNLVPLVFLWEWAGRLRSARQRAAFRATQVLWILLVPAAVGAGAVDRWLHADPGVVARFVGDGRQVVAASAPPLTRSVLGVDPTTVGLRFLVVFAFLQTMHYVVWVAFLPRFAPDASRAFESRVPWLTGRRAWLVGLTGAAFLAVLFVSDYWTGKALYAAVATYHAYLEFPVLLALLMNARRLVSRPAPR